MDYEKYIERKGAFHRVKYREKLTDVKEKTVGRENSLNDLVVSIDINGEMVPFQVDEISQRRLSIRLTFMDKNNIDSIKWINANNDIVSITSQNIADILELASIEQNKIWGIE